MGIFTKAIWASETDSRTVPWAFHKGEAVLLLCTGMADEAGYPEEP